MLNLRKSLLLIVALLTCHALQAQESSIETCSNGEPTTERGLPDEDADGIANAVDNCRDHPNTDQRDTNGDGIGNVCDADFNNDSVVNVIDLSILRAQFFADDANPDADLDGDGVVALTDLALLRQLFFKPPGPVGACLRDPTLCAGPKHFEVNDAARAGSLVVIRTSDPASIYHAKRLIDGASQCNSAIAGYTYLGSQPWNPNWGFHVTGDIYFHGDTINASVGCNKTASYVEDNLGTWCNIDNRATSCQFWCPWTSGLTRVIPPTTD
ncbi:MAG: thrombospondin type 3 repeat-containing protein [Gammaproteobacteria bacterium]